MPTAAKQYVKGALRALSSLMYDESDHEASIKLIIRTCSGSSHGSCVRNRSNSTDMTGILTGHLSEELRLLLASVGLRMMCPSNRGF